MRLGIIADVHANLPALSRALEHLAAEGADRSVCLGDLVGYGPQPNEVVAVIAERGIPTVIGNHDLVAAGLDPLDRSGPEAQKTLSWTRSAISDETRSFLSALPRELDVGEGILATHGALDDPWRYVRRSPDAVAQIEGLTTSGRGEVLLVGHTHRQMVVDIGARTVATAAWVRSRSVRTFSVRGPALINPGAVGQSREPRALVRCGLLDTSARTLNLYALRYNVGACRALLQQRNLPPEWCHARPTLKKTLRQVLRDAEDRRVDLSAEGAGRST